MTFILHYYFMIYIQYKEIQGVVFWMMYGHINNDIQLIEQIE